MNTKLRSAFVATLVVIPLVVGFPACVDNAKTPTTSFTNVTTSPLLTTITSNAATTCTVISPNGLSLSLTIDSTVYKSGDTVSINIVENNTLSKENDVSIADLWPAENLTLGGCGTLYFPFGASILQGFYDSTNIVAAIPLQSLYDPNAFYSCPVFIRPDSYNFQPSSDMAVPYSKYSGNQPISYTMAFPVKSAGFWTGERFHSTFSSFTPGIYTVVAGDEWGALAILHFTVT